MAGHVSDIVPREYLEPPDADDMRELLRDEAAELLDGFLRRLARQEALIRVALGRLAERLLERRAYRALGFVRLSDYARERLGQSGREVQSLARVSRRMATLAKIAAAFEQGQLGWTKLRVLVEVASPATEEAWLSLAQGATASRLAEIATEHAARGQPSTTNDPADIARSDDAQLSNDPSDATDPAHTARSPDTSNVAPDDEPRVRIALTCPRRVAALWRRARRMAEQVAGSELCEWQAAEAICAEGLSAASVAAPGPPAQPYAPALRSQPVDIEQAAEPRCDRLRAAGYGEVGGEPFEPRDLAVLREALDWSAVADALPSSLETFANDLDALDPHDLDGRLRQLLAAAQRVDWQIGRLLRTFFNLRLHLHLGFPTSASYIKDRLAMSVRKARGLYRLESHCLRGGLGLAKAYRAGRISWCRAHTLVPILDETNAAAWIARAGEVTLRRLIDEVGWARDVRDTTPGGRFPMPPPPGMNLDARRYGPAMQFGAHGVGSTGDPDLLRIGPGGTADLEEQIVFVAPQSVAELLGDAIDAFRAPADPPWHGLARLLSHVLHGWSALPGHPDPVFARDGWRCQVPACSSRRELQDHHVVFRSHGGDNSLANRIAVCAWHHLRAIHAGLVRARPGPGLRISWDLGLRRAGPPLMRTVGDFYRDRPSPYPAASGLTSRSTISPATPAPRSGVRREASDLAMPR